MNGSPCFWEFNLYSVGFARKGCIEILPYSKEDGPDALFATNLSITAASQAEKLPTLNADLVSARPAPPWKENPLMKVPYLNHSQPLPPPEPVPVPSLSYGIQRIRNMVSVSIPGTYFMRL